MKKKINRKLLTSGSHSKTTSWFLLTVILSKPSLSPPYLVFFSLGILHCVTAWLNFHSHLLVHRLKCCTSANASQNEIPVQVQQSKLEKQLVKGTLQFIIYYYPSHWRLTNSGFWGMMLIRIWGGKRSLTVIYWPILQWCRAYQTFVSKALKRGRIAYFF